MDKEKNKSTSNFFHTILHPHLKISTFNSFSSSDYFLIWLSGSIMIGAHQMMGIAQGYWIYELTDSATILGIIAAIDRSYIDQILSRSIDTLMAIPVMIFTFILLSVFGPSNLNLILILGVLESTRFFRISRSVAVGQVVLEYVEVAKLRGEKLSYIIFREILPNIASPLIVEFGVRFIFIIFTVSSLSFLGLGIQPPAADWAAMVRENAILIQYAQYDITAGLTPLIPAAIIALLALAINFVIDWYLYITSGLKDDIK